MTTAEPYEFVGGYPTPATVKRAYDEADLNRAVSAYRFFYPTVSIEATWQRQPVRRGGAEQGVPAAGRHPRQLVFTPNSDTPYSAVAVDLSVGPIVLELPPGPLMGTANDLNQRWVLDIGLPGPSRGGRRQAPADPARLRRRDPRRLLHRHRHDQPGARPGPRAAGRHGHGPGDRADEVDQDLPAAPGPGLDRTGLDRPDQDRRRRLHPRPVGRQPRLLAGAARDPRCRAAVRRRTGSVRRTGRSWASPRASRSSPTSG